MTAGEQNINDVFDALSLYLAVHSWLPLVIGAAITLLILANELLLSTNPSYARLFFFMTRNERTAHYRRCLTLLLLGSATLFFWAVKYMMFAIPYSGSLLLYVVYMFHASHVEKTLRQIREDRQKQ